MLAVWTPTTLFSGPEPALWVLLISPLPLWERMPEGQERGRERSERALAVAVVLWNQKPNPLPALRATLSRNGRG